jgi:hypothetical protein
MGMGFMTLWITKERGVEGVSGAARQRRRIAKKKKSQRARRSKNHSGRFQDK